MKNPAQHPAHRQKGVATLLVAVMLVLLISVGVFSTGRSVLSEIKSTQNTYWAKQARQSADGGIDYAMAWLSQPLNDPHWVADGSNPPFDFKGSALTYSENTYSVSVVPYRQSDHGIIDLVASATGTDKSRATVRQQIALLNLLAPGYDHAPLIINGCLSGVTGTPNLGQNAAGVSLSTSKSGSCISPGHLTMTGSIQQNALAGSAWNAVFGMSQADLKAFAGTPANDALKAQGGGIYFYDASSPAPSNFHNSVGSTTTPAVVVFGAGSGCPKINGGPTIYGIVYYDASCSAQDPGWGGATIFGSVVVDGDITKFTANGQINATSQGNADFKIPSVPVRVMGSWRDF